MKMCGEAEREFHMLTLAVHEAEWSVAALPPWWIWKEARWATRVGWDAGKNLLLLPGIKNKILLHPVCSLNTTLAQITETMHLKKIRFLKFSLDNGFSWSYNYCIPCLLLRGITPALFSLVIKHLRQYTTIYGLDCRFLEVAGILMFIIIVSRMVLEPTWPPIQ